VKRPSEMAAARAAVLPVWALFDDCIQALENRNCWRPRGSYQSGVVPGNRVGTGTVRKARNSIVARRARNLWRERSAVSETNGLKIRKWLNSSRSSRRVARCSEAFLRSYAYFVHSFFPKPVDEYSPQPERLW